MKSALCSSVLKPALLIVPLALCFGGSTVAQAGAELQGYLKVYLVTDGINDGDAWYFPRSSFAIYTIDIDRVDGERDRKSTRLNSSHSQISYAVFCLKKKK